MITSKLKELRRAHGDGISQAQLAKRVGVSRFYISKIENGKIRPNSEVMFRIARYLGFSVDRVFGYRDGEE